MGGTSSIRRVDLVRIMRNLIFRELTADGEADEGGPVHVELLPRVIERLDPV